MHALLLAKTHAVTAAASDTFMQILCLLAVTVCVKACLQTRGQSSKKLLKYHEILL